MSGNRDREIFFAEGFGYSTTDFRRIYPNGTGVASATVDTTTVPGRNFVRVPAGQYVDIQLPRTDVWPYTQTFNDGSWVWVIQGKIYIDAASYTNVSSNSYLFEMMSSNNGFSNFGLSPNTSVNQDNWYIKFSDVTTDYANNANNGPMPAIPMRTVKDIKFIIRVYNGNDSQAWGFIDDYQVAYTNGIPDQADNMNWNFKGFRIWGLANQTGPTLWGDLIAYRAYYNTETLAIGTTISGGAVLPASTRVYDVTPNSTTGGINEFATVGAGDPVTALSTLDDSTYVVSNDYGQAFRLKPALPDAYTGDNSTAVTITDSSNVYGFNYMSWTKDMELSSSIGFAGASDANTNYRYRYYRLLLSTYSGTDTSSTINDVGFYSESGFIPISGATMRLNSAGGVSAAETSGATVNTTVHTELLSDLGTNLNIYSTINALTGQDIRNDSIVAEYIIDMGEGNVGPDWASFGITQSQNNGSSSRLRSAALFGSDDNSSWYLLVDNYDTISAGGYRTTDYLTNPRHPSYVAVNPDARTRVFDYAPNNRLPQGAGFYPNHIAQSGDPFASAHYAMRATSKTPVPFRQFKDYQFGIETVQTSPATYLPAAPAVIGPVGTVNFDYPNFSSTTDLLLRGSGTGGGQQIGNDIYLTTTAGGIGNLYRTVPSQFNFSWNMTWNMEVGGGNGADGTVLQWTPNTDNVGSGGGGVGTIYSSIHSLQFRTYGYNRITWIKNGSGMGDYALGSDWRRNLYFWAEYDHAQSRLSITYSTSNLWKPRPQAVINGFSFSGGTNYYVNFGAATGGSVDNHILKSWKFAIP